MENEAEGTRLGNASAPGLQRDERFGSFESVRFIALDAHAVLPMIIIAAPVKSPGDNALSPPRASDSTEQQPARQQRLLVVDDNRDAAETMAEALQAEGYQVDIAFNGIDALARAAQSPPDIVLLDIGLPVMDGYELATRLRQSRPPGSFHLIALTGYGQDSDRKRSREAGFDLHLVKPVDIETVLKAVKTPVT